MGESDAGWEVPNAQCKDASPVLFALDRLPTAPAEARECASVAAESVAPAAALLFDPPANVTSLALPFTAPETDMASRALRFYRLLRTRLRAGFLVLRRAARTG